jgi:hypothetical protein
VAGAVNELHPSVEEITDYFEGRLSLQRETALDMHFDECGTCAKSARRVRVLSCLVSGWSADTHRQAAEESRLLRALERACAAPSCAQWRERLLSWMGNWQGKSEAALRVALRQTRESIQASISSLAVLTRPGALWPEFAPLVAMATRGKAEAPETVVRSSGEGPRVLVAALPAEGVVRVEIEGTTMDVARLIMLVPDDPNAQLLLAEFRPGLQPERFVAVFEPVGPGSYTLVIEPPVFNPPTPARSNGVL